MNISLLVLLFAISTVGVLIFVLNSILEKPHDMTSKGGLFGFFLFIAWVFLLFIMFFWVLFVGSNIF